MAKSSVGLAPSILMHYEKKGNQKFKAEYIKAVTYQAMMHKNSNINSY